MKKIAILNGPNLDRLGLREPSVYGNTTLTQLEDSLHEEFSGEANLDFYQSNHEGDLIDKISALAAARTDALIINAGGLTHTSVSLRDAIAGSGIPTLEVHISNVYKREPFRHTSLLAPVCVGVIAGLGLDSYRAALRHLLSL